VSLPFRLMGIVNVTPDSFSDGGLFLDAQAAVAHGRELEAQGADILDIGGESTRPGAEPVGEQEELRRVLPVIEGLAGRRKGLAGRRTPAHSGTPLHSGTSAHPGTSAHSGTSAHPGTSAHLGTSAHPQISIDTSKAVVARAALQAGASLVNDVSALRADPAMAEVVAESGAECCLMHMLGEPRTMQADPRYDDVVDEVKSFLEQRLRFAVSEGVPEERILLDPGIGFGKTERHNLELLRRLGELCELGRPILIGTSRKQFLGRIQARAAGRAEPAGVADRLAGTLASNVLAYERGASVFRVHEVAPVRDALAVAAATLGLR
jgi:dihydropteroate synthase